MHRSLPQYGDRLTAPTPRQHVVQDDPASCWPFLNPSDRPEPSTLVPTRIGSPHQVRESMGRQAPPPRPHLSRLPTQTVGSQVASAAAMRARAAWSTSCQPRTGLRWREFGERGAQNLALLVAPTASRVGDMRGRRERVISPRVGRSAFPSRPGCTGSCRRAWRGRRRRSD